MSWVLSEKIHDQIRLVTLNRPDKRNALNGDLLDELAGAVAEAVHYRVLMFNGLGPCFCSGLDLTESTNPDLPEKLARVIGLIYASPCVTIACAHGAAVAGGAAILAACDFALVTPDIQIGYPATRRGIIAAPVLRFLKEQLGDRAARELLLLGELVGAEWAVEKGMVNGVASEVHLLPIALMFAQKVLKGAPKATQLTKQVLDEQYSHTGYHDLEHALSYHRGICSSPEAQEGANAFLEKRPPRW